METTIDINYFNFALGFLLMAIPIAIFAYYRTGLVKSTVISIVRMTIQLFLVGFYLKYIFEWDKWWLNLLWALIMVVVAAHTIGGRTNMKRIIFIIPIFTAILSSMFIVDGFFLGIVIKLDNVFSAMYFIPITGMIIGNSLKDNVVALNDFYKSLNKNRVMYNFYLANGASRAEALKPFMRKSLQTAFNPRIASTAVIGLIALPGMMTGQLLGGSSPEIAIKYQIMLVITIFAASTITVFLTILLVNRFVFDQYDRLKTNLFNF